MSSSEGSSSVSILSVSNNKSYDNIDLVKTDITDKSIFFNVRNGDHDLLVQTPKMKIDTSKGLLFFQNSKEKDHKINDFYVMVRKIEEKISKCLSDKSKIYFGKDIPFDDVYNDLFKSCIKVPTSLCDGVFSMNVRFLFNEDIPGFEFYNSKHEPLSVSELKKHDAEFTCLLVAKELVVTPMQAKIDWEVIQVMAHKPKKVLKGPAFRQETSSNVEVLDLGVFKPEEIVPKILTSEINDITTKNDKPSLPSDSEKIVNIKLLD